MSRYTVTVKVTMLEFYDVEADSPEEAVQCWDEGDYRGCDDTHLDAEPLRVRRGQHTLWRKP